MMPHEQDHHDKQLKDAVAELPPEVVEAWAKWIFHILQKTGRLDGPVERGNVSSLRTSGPKVNKGREMERKGYITLEQAAELFPTEDGTHMHVNTVAEWITKGKQGVTLKAWKPGKRYYTTASEVQRFLEAVESAKEDLQTRVAQCARPSRAQRAAVRAGLARHGL